MRGSNVRATYALCTAALCALLGVVWTGCGAEPAATGAAESEARPAPVGEAAEAILTCGNAGQTCCANHTCNAGLACNSNNICRIPCGDTGEKCCAGNPSPTCNAGLACNANGICRACGAPGDLCCAGSTCTQEPGQPVYCIAGRCEACGEQAGQPCCNGRCDTGLGCDSITNSCVPCGFISEDCCGGNTCLQGVCGPSGLCEPG